MSRAPQLRSGRVLSFGPASLATLMGSVAEELIDSKVTEWFARCGGPLGVDFQLVWTTEHVVQRRDMALPGLWEPHLCACYVSCWSHFDW